MWLAPLFTMLIAAATFWAGWIARILKGEKAAADVAALATRVADAEKNLADFKVTVASTYASHQTIGEMEQRVTSAIDRLGDRLDRVLERAAGSA